MSDWETDLFIPAEVFHPGKDYEQLKLDGKNIKIPTSIWNAMVSILNHEQCPYASLQDMARHGLQLVVELWADKNRWPVDLANRADVVASWFQAQEITNNTLREDTILEYLDDLPTKTATERIRKRQACNKLLTKVHDPAKQAIIRAMLVDPE